MTIKTTSAELKRFYNDPAFWYRGVQHEDEKIIVNGVDQGYVDIDELPDNARVTVSGGIVLWPNQEDGKEPSFEGYFKKWLKTQTYKTIVVEVDNEFHDNLIAVIKAAGGKIK